MEKNQSINSKGDNSMKYKKTISILVLGALAVATAIGAFAYRSVSAATPATVTTSNTAQANSSWGVGNGFRGGFTKEDLANALGITVDELNTAYQNAYAAALTQAVEQGLITQAQADQLTTNGNAFPFGDRWDGWLTQNGIDFNALLANALGITVDQLKAAYLTAYNTRIDQAVTDGNLTQAQADLMKGQNALYANNTFQSTMQSAFQSAVNAAVAAGVITQAQADAILSNTTNIGMPGMGDLGGPGGGHGRGGPGGFGDGTMPGTTTSPTTTP
jgi:hypothetical protein